MTGLAENRHLLPRVTGGNSRKWRETAICYGVTVVTSRHTYACTRVSLIIYKGNKSNRVTNRSRQRVCAVTVRIRNDACGNSP